MTNAPGESCVWAVKKACHLPSDHGYHDHSQNVLELSDRGQQKTSILYFPNTAMEKNHNTQSCFLELSISIDQFHDLFFHVPGPKSALHTKPDVLKHFRL